MDQLKFFRGVCSWGHVLFAIMKVLALLGAVFTLIGVLTLSFMPGGLVKMESTVKMDIRVEMIKLLGDDWAEISKDFSLSDIGEGFDDGVVDEKGVTLSQSVSGQTFENRAISLALVPIFVQMLLSYFLFRLIAQVFRSFKLAAEPLRLDLKSQFYRGGWLLLALGTVPGVTMSLITFITDTEGLFESQYNLALVFAGFVVWALWDLLAHAKSFLPAEAPFTQPAESEEIHPDAF